ncbi:MAG: SRPBCC family protein [Pirellulaceae bacterium]|nr:SRPBCC family protein [Pirellulaceae bacterium]
MKVYHVAREQFLPLPVPDVFSFFSDARNLEELTPAWLNFQFLTPEPITMRVGTIIQYALRVRALPIRWTTAITSWDPPFEFVDVQLQGPYAMWHHRHRFVPIDKGTQVIDEVAYALPFGSLGRLLHKLVVHRDVQQIFEYRRQALETKFSKNRPPIGFPAVKPIPSIPMSGKESLCEIGK